VNRQEIFDKVAKHLLTQNRQAKGKTGCAYRGDNGDKCAIGCLIPDEDYGPKMENGAPRIGDPESLPLNTRLVTAFCREKLGASTDEDILFLTRLQSLHDYSPPEDWRGELQSFAAQYELSAAVLG
jgi:hypothetical protein